MKRQDNPVLVFGLLGNAAFSLTTGLILITSATPVAEVLGLERPGDLRFLGLNLIGFAAWLVIAYRRKRTLVPEIYVISALDALWVAGSLIILSLGLAPLTLVGSWIVAGVALAVALFMTLQIMGVRRQQALQSPA